MIAHTSGDDLRLFGTSCDQCQDDIIASNRSEYVERGPSPSFLVLR